MAPVMVYSAVTVRASSTFSFRNPFPEPITVHVDMQLEDDHNSNGNSNNAFTLLLKQPMCQIVAFGSLQVPFIFVPHAISEYKATVVIERPAGDGTGSLRWQYPIRGVAEGRSGLPYNFCTLKHS
jgi:hypothetical protein